MAAGDVLWDGASGYEMAVVEVPTSTTPAGIAKATGVVVLNAAGVATTPVTGYTEDAASAADPVGPMMMARRRDVLVTNEVSATGDNIALNATSKGELCVSNGGYNFANITTSTTTTVKSGAGVLHTISINALGTVASTTTVYDNTTATGTKIATINTLAGQESYLYDVIFATGLTIVTTGTVAPDITVSYR